MTTPHRPPAHYGDPLGEQRRFLAGRAVVDLSDRDVLAVTGPDRLSWLHSLTTQALTGLPAYTSAETLVLSPHGHIEHALHLVDDGETAWITVEPGSGEPLRAWLESMRFMLRVEVADRTADYAVIGEPLRGEGAPGGPVTWVDPWPGPVGETAEYARPPYDDHGETHPGVEWRLREVLVPRAELPARLAEAAVEEGLAGSMALEALRIAAWRPRFGSDTDHRTIPHELDWLRTAVHLRKGCYRGQETIARVRNLGRPPRRLVFLHLDGSEHLLPDPGTPLHLGDREVGRITSVARHHEDGPIALAVVRRNTEPDAVLTAGTITAAQTTVVNVDGKP